MTLTLKLLGGPLDGDYHVPWPDLRPGYAPARHNGREWVSVYEYRNSGRRLPSYCDGHQAVDADNRKGMCGRGCPSFYRRPAPPPPAG